jgi:cyclic-di-AMP phosphodiesterase PgpH
MMESDQIEGAHATEDSAAVRRSAARIVNGALADRAKLAQVVRRRPKVGPLAALLMSLVFALVAAPLVMADVLLIKSGAVTFEVGEAAPLTLRVPQFSGFTSKGIELSEGSVVVGRGAIVDDTRATLARAVIAEIPSGLPAFTAYFAALFLLALMYTTQLRRSHRGKLIRTQAVTLLMLLGVALVAKLMLVLSPLSVFLIPVATGAIIATLVVDVSAGLATGLTASVLVGLLVPFEGGVLAVLGVQSATAALSLGERRTRNRRILLAGLLSGLAGLAAYMVFYYLSTEQSPLAQLSDPLYSPLAATVAGGLLAAALAIPVQPLYQYLLGDITKNKLVELEDLSNPLLRRIAESSPGTWQHSLAMANMAEIAANTIGANGRLVRVGAYYHDLGKSLQPKYFIENLEAGETSPHDRLPPEVSCDAIFAHVTEGIRLARKAGLPERIIDFMHMHHGDGLLEYFWAKCQESGNPNNLTAEDFRYPGVPPQSRETAILAICDAVEAASRTLKSPDEKAISNLVQRIVYGKLHLGQLDESGMSMADLRKISNSLRETIKHAHHGRIEYPWQRQQREEEEKERAASTESDGTSRAATAPMVEGGMTQRFIIEPRLDSLDVPRPYWRDPRSQRLNSVAGSGPVRRTIEHAATERLDEPGLHAQPEPSAAAAARPAAEPAVATPSAVAMPSAVTAAAPTQIQPGHEIDAAIHSPAAQDHGVPAEISAPPEAGSGRSGNHTKLPLPLPDPDFDERTDAMPPSMAIPPALIMDDEPAQPAQHDDQATMVAEHDPDHFDDRPTQVAEELSPGATMPATMPATTPPPPPPGSPARSRPGTIELMKEPEATPSREELVREDAIEEEEDLMPGILVLGPPPATRPERDVRKSAVDLPVVAPVTILPRKKGNPE